MHILERIEIWVPKLQCIVTPTTPTFHDILRPYSLRYSAGKVQDNSGKVRYGKEPALDHRYPIDLVLAGHISDAACSLKPQHSELPIRSSNYIHGKTKGR